LKYRNLFTRFSSAILIFAVLIGTFLYPFRTDAAGAPAVISYQGRLADSSGNLVGGSGTSYYFKFSLWTSSTVGAGSKVWPSASPIAFTSTVKQGVFTVNIGDVAAGYPDTLNYDFSNPNVYLQVEVSSDGSTFETLSPRQQLSSTAFAQVANTATVASTVNGTGDSVLGNATSTNFFSNIASSNNLFSTNANFGSALFGNATTTGLALSGLTSSLLKTNSLGQLVVATSGDFFSTTSANYLFSQKTTDNLTEGTTNLFFTDSRADARAISILSATTTLGNLTTLTGLTDLIATNATSTNLFASTGVFTNLIVTNPIAGAITGNAGTATILATARNINGISFNGSSDITITAASSTLLANNNTFSGNNTFSNTITGAVSGNAGSVTNGVYTTSFNGLFDTRFDTNLAATTTLNNVAVLKGLTDTITTRATTTNATTTNFYVSGNLYGANLSSCNTTTGKLLWLNGQFTCGTDAGSSGTGITAFGAQYSTAQTGSTQILATSSDTNIGLIITSTSDTHTFTPTWIGTLADSRVSDALTISGGTVNNTPIGASSASTAIFTNATATAATTTNLFSISGAFTNLSATNQITGSVSGNAGTVTNGVYTTTFGGLFDNRLSATTSVSGITALPNLSITNSQVSDFSTGINAYINASTTIPKAYTSNVFTGANTFNQAITGSVSGNAGSVTNGVYTTTFGTLFDTRFDTNLAATTTLNNITTLKGLTDLIATRATTTNATSTNFFATTGVFTNLTATNQITGSITGNAGTATVLQTGRLINGISFNGSSDITITAASSTLLANNNTFSGTNTFGSTITGSVSGNAGTVTNGVYTTTFNGLFDTALAATSTLNNITTLKGLTDLIATRATTTNSTSTSLFATAGLFTNLTATNQITGSVSGNAGSATVLQTARNINNVLFNGSADITINAASSTLLANSNTFSGNNSFGQTITGSISGNAGTVTNGVYTTSFNGLFDPRFDTALAATTTLNNLTTLKGLTDTITTRATTTNATSTNLYIANNLYGANLSSCNSTTGKLLWSNGQFTCGTDAGSSGTGITAFGAQYSTAQTGSTQILATSSDTNIGLIITSAGDTHTFTPTWIGSLAANRGGTGITNPSAAGILLGSYAGGSYQQLATSSLGLLTTNVTEGNNLYFTNPRADARINATTTLGTLQYLANLVNTTTTAATTTNLFGTTGVFTNLTATNQITGSVSGNAGTVTNGVYTTTFNGLFDPRFDTNLAATTTLNNLTTLKGLTDTITTRATSTNATSTNFFATTASSTNLFAATGSLGNLIVANPISGSITGSAGSVAASALTGNTLASGVTASSLTSVGTLGSLSVTGLSTLTGGFLAGASSTLQNFTALNSTSSQATTTSLFAFTASSTNLFSTLLTTGAITANSLTTSGAISAGSFSGAGTGLTGSAASLSIGGNAGTATVLATGRNINGVSFNGGSNITITAASSTVLADNNTFGGTNTFSSLITGSVSGNAGTVTNGVYTTTFGGLFDTALAGTTTLNNLTTLKGLTDTITTRATTTNATSTSFFATTASSTNLFAQAASIGALTVTSCTGCSSGGVTALGPIGQTQTGPTVTFATSSTAFNGLTASTTITGSGNTLTFTNSLAGVLGAGGGGTGITSPSAAGILLGSYAGGSYQQLSTSTLGLLTTNVAEGTNQYFTNARVNSYIDASTTIAKAYSANTFTGANTFNQTITGSISGNAGTVTNGVYTTTFNSLFDPRFDTNLAATTTLNNLTTLKGVTDLIATRSTTTQATTTNFFGTTGVFTNLTATNQITGSVSGNAGSATVLQTARNINNVLFNGSADITVTAASSTLLANNNTFSGTNSFGQTITGSISGNAGTVTNGVYTTTFGGLFDTALAGTTTLNNLTTLKGVTDLIATRSTTTQATTTNFFGTTGVFTNLTATNAINGSVTGAAGSVAASALTGNTLASGVTASSLTSVGTLGSLSVTGLSTLSGGFLAGASSTLQNFTALNSTSSQATTTNLFATTGAFTNLTSTNTITGSISGNAGTATVLQTGRNINGVSFNGGSNITITAASSTVLADNNTFGGNNTFSSLITGSVSGNAGTVTNGVYTTTFNGLFDTRFDTNLAATTTLNNLTTLKGLTDTITTRATSTQATSTNLFATTGTFTNLTATNAINGSVTGAAGSVAASALTGNTLASGVTASSLTSVGTLGSLSVTGLSTLTGGFLSSASSTLQNFTALNSTSTQATSTNLFATTGAFTNLSSTNTITGSVSGNAGTATVLQTGRNINGISFNGGSNITITAASSTILADSNTFGGTNTFSSLITGSISGNAGTVTNGVYTTTFNGLFDTRFDTNLAATTTLNNLTTLKGLTDLIATRATTTSATSTNFFSTNAVHTNLYATKLSNLTTNGFVKTSGSDGTLSIDTNTYLTSAVTSFQQSFGTAQTGAITVATTSDTNLLLNVTNSGGTFTFAPTWTGSLAAGRGGTGITNPTAAGILLGSYAGGSYQQLSTSTLGLLTTNVAEGNNLYFTQTRFDNALTATTTLPALTTLKGLTDVIATRSTTTAATTTSLFSTTASSSNLFSQAATIGTLTVTSCTGCSAGGGVTALGPLGQTQVGPTVTFATSSTAFNGLTASTTITGSGNTLTFTNTLAGLLTAGGGGTGIASPSAAGILLGSYAGGSYQQLSTSTLGLLTTNVAEGNNLYFTNVRADNRINATTTLGTLQFLANLVNTTTTAATTTNFFATTASSTNMFSTLLTTGGITSGAINGQTISAVASFSGTLNVTSGLLTVANALHTGSTTLQAFTFTTATGTAATTTSLFSATAAFTNLTSTNTITGSISGNAGTATVLQTGRNINGVSFNGGANITITAASSTLLADSNTFSGNNAFSQLITGSVSGNAGTVTNGVYTTSFNGLFDTRFDTNLIATSTLNNITTLKGLTDLIATRATTTNATSTNFFATTASSTNLFAQAASIGALTVTSCTGCGGAGASPAGSGTELQFRNGAAFGAISSSAFTSALGTIGFGTTTPQFLLHLASSTKPQLALSDSSLTSNAWTFRNAGGILYLATSSPSTFATSTSAALSINSSGLVSSTNGFNALAGASYQIGDVNVVTGDANFNYFFGPSGNTTLTGDNNTGFGSTNAFTVLTTGSANVGIGSAVMSADTIGSDNVAVGASALSYNITGSGNTALGKFALGRNNSATSSVAVGFAAGRGNGLFGEAFKGGVYIGYQAGQFIQTGADFDTFVGYQAGLDITTGSRNILIGAATIVASTDQVTSGSNNISIGNDVAVVSPTASNQLNIGNLIYGSGLSGTGATISPGTIGIGTTTPQFLLHLASSIKPQLALSDSSLTSNAWTFRNAGGILYLATSSPSTFATSSAVAFSISANAIPTFSALGGSTGCAQLSSTGVLSNTGSACGGGSSPGGSGTELQFRNGAAFGAVTNTAFDVAGGFIGIGTTTPRALLALATSTAPQLVLNDGSLTSNKWAFRNAGGIFYLATSSPSTFATSTVSALSLNANGQLTVPFYKATAGTFLAADPNGLIIATSTPAGGGGSPGGSDGNIQYKSGTSFLGDSNLNWSSGTKTLSVGTGVGVTTPALIVFDTGNTSSDPTGSAGAMYYNSNLGIFRCYDTAWHACGSTQTIMTLLNQADPATPAADTLDFYAKKIAGKMIPKIKGPSGLDTPLQNALWQNNTLMWFPGTATAGVWNGAIGAVTSAGTYAVGLPSTTNLYTVQQRGRYANIITTTNQILGIRHTSNPTYFLGNTAGQGGFFFYARVGFDTWTNGGRMFVGLTANTAGTTVSADPSATANSVGFAVDAADNGAVSFLMRSATTPTKTATGITIVSNRGYDLYMFAAPNSTTVGYRIVDTVNGTEASGSVSVNPPAVNTMMLPNILSSNAALTTATAINFGINRVYIETDY
jgi:hypothetical protein